VPKGEIDKRYLNQPYYIAPNGKVAVDAFAVIRDAMKDKDRVALARIVLTNREHVIAVEPLGKGLLGTTLRYPYELRDEEDYFDDIKSPKISKDMIELASYILDTKAAHFDPSKFEDEYEDALKTMVRRKAAGKPSQIGRARGKAGQCHQPDGCASAEPEGQGIGKAVGAFPGAPGDAPPRKKSAPLAGAGTQGELRTVGNGNIFANRTGLPASD
jgi:DNA end-binding protein Ku